MSVSSLLTLPQPEPAALRALPSAYPHPPSPRPPPTTLPSVAEREQRSRRNSQGRGWEAVRIARGWRGDFPIHKTTIPARRLPASPAPPHPQQGRAGSRRLGSKGHVCALRQEVPFYKSHLVSSLSLYRRLTFTAEKHSRLKAREKMAWVQ